MPTRTDTFAVKCPHCSAGLRIKRNLAGTEGHCPKCHAAFVVPDPLQETIIDALPVDDDAATFRRKVTGLAIKTGLLATWIIGAVVACVYWFEPPGPGWLVGYIGVVAFVSTTWGLITLTKGFPPRLQSGNARGAVCFILSIASLWAYFRTATYVKSWTDVNAKIDYRDTYNRSRQIVERVMWWRDPDSPCVYMKGQFSETGKLHGRWVTMLRNNSRLSPGEFVDPFLETWYWYGEKITEGEWHLRNK